MLRRFSQPESLPAPTSTVAKAAGMAGSGCGILFSIPFFLAGMACLLGSLYANWTVLRVRSWVEVPATLAPRPMEVEKSSDEDERSEALLYRYQWEGRTYSSNQKTVGKVHMSGEDEGLPDLNLARETERTIPCFVNPANPQEAALVKPKAQLLPMFLGIFALSHGGVGLGLMLGSFVSLARQRKRHQLAALYPGDPAKWRPDWEQGEVRAHVGVSRWGWLYVSLVWVLVAGFSCFLILTEERSLASTKWISVAIAAVGLVPFHFMLKTWRHYLKYGRLVLQLPSEKLALGRKLQISLAGPVELLADVEMADRLVLRCVNRVTQGSGEDRSTREDVRVEDANAIRPVGTVNAYGSSGTAGFDLILPPQGQVATAVDHNEVGVRWELVVKNAADKIMAAYTLPIFERSSEIPVEDPSRPGIRETPYTPDEIEHELRSEKIECFRKPDGTTEYHFGPRRHSLPAVVSLVLAIGFSVLGVAAFFFAVPFAILWSVAVLFIIRMAINDNFGQLFVTAGGRGLVLMKVMPWGTKRSEFTSGEISRVDLTDRNVQYNNTTFYTVKAWLKSGKSVAVSMYFANPESAEAYAQALREGLGLVGDE